MKDGRYWGAVALVAATTVAILYLARPDGMGRPATGELMVDVSVPPLEGAALAGRALFDANCAECHGEDARGREGLAPPLVHKIYEPNHHADAAFFLAASGGVRAHHWPFGNMPPVDGLSEPDIDKIVAYIRALQRENGVY
jgi:mono/diheme cytochrome c family protein